MSESPMALLGRDILACGGTTIHMYPEQVLCLPLVETEINPDIWATKGRIGQPITACPVQDSTSYPHQRQYPLKHKAQEGLKIIIDNLRKQVLLKASNSP